jgi:hypothetical protein
MSVVDCGGRLGGWGPRGVVEGADCAFKLRLAFLRVNAARVSWRQLANLAAVAIVTFWLGAVTTGGLGRRKP